MTPENVDELVANAFTAAIDLQPKRLTKRGKTAAWPDERRWGREICNQLAAAGVLAEAAIDAEQLATPSGNWDPPPGRVDLHPRQLNGPPGSLFVAELKLENINESLWDAFKLIWVAAALRTGAQYLACAASDRRWNDPSGGGELFPIAGVREMSSFDLIKNCREKWCWQWRHDRANPRRVPTSLETVAVLSGHRPLHYPELELRVVRISNHSTTMHELTNGVPSGLLSCEAAR